MSEWGARGKADAEQHKMRSLKVKCVLNKQQKLMLPACLLMP
jgi:hypothetical protein